MNKFHSFQHMLRVFFSFVMAFIILGAFSQVSHASSGFHGNHFYTTNVEERNYAVQSLGFIDETAYDSQIYVFPQHVTSSVRLHRYYNPDAGDHFYCTDNACKSPPPGYVEESDIDTMWVFSSLDVGLPLGTSAQLNRYYNPGTSDHFYCTYHSCGNGNPIPGYVNEDPFDDIVIAEAPVTVDELVVPGGVTAVQLFRLYHP